MAGQGAAALVGCVPAGVRPGPLVLGNLGDAPTAGKHLTLRPWEARIYRL